MKKNDDITFLKLRQVNSILSTGFHMIKNSGNFESIIQNKLDRDMFGELVYRSKSRFTTYSGILSTYIEPAYSEVTLAIIHSFIDSFKQSSKTILDNSYFYQYHDEVERLLDNHFPENKLATTSANTYKKIVAPMIKDFRKRVKVGFGTEYSCYAALLLAHRILDSISLENLEKNKIVREIKFPKDLTQAGIGLLNYFSQIVEDKYPNVEVSITIQQNDNTVTMIVEHPDGSHDEISHTLNQYGLVLANKAKPEDLLEDRLHILKLEQKLQMAEMEVRHTRDFLVLEQNNSELRIQSLESEVAHLREIVGKSMSTNEQMQQQLLLHLSNQLGPEVFKEHQADLNNFLDAVSKHEKARTRVIVEDIHLSSPSLFNELKRLIIEGAFTGVVGNAAFQWLLPIFQSFG